ncbi:MAG: CPBP family intramembrane metalloprotease [Ruminococcaceae bacterium]|nr:CPBP family intramembrane metalloprotease [Oscillospiraceae bacterium]
MRKNMIIPSREERIFGWIYAIIGVEILPYLINFLCSGLGFRLHGAYLNLVYFVLNFLIVALAFRRFWARTGKEILNRTLWSLFIAVVLFSVYLLVSQLLGRLILWLKPDFINVNDQSVAAIAGNYYIPTLICTVFLVPVTEECLHRGVIFGSLFKRNPVLAYAVSTIIFSVIHIHWQVGDPALIALSILQYIPAGLCLAAAYHLSGSIVAPILIHMAVNAIGMIALR